MAGTDTFHDGLLLDRAAGVLTPARALLAETYVRLNANGRARAARADVAGGALLEGIEPEPLTTAPLAPASIRSRKGRIDTDLRASWALISAAVWAPDRLHWRWRAPALREVRLPTLGATLVRLAGGRSVPAHDHTDEELTLVLSGVYGDATGVYRVGDIACADAGLEHSPHVPEGETCICLVVGGGALKFRGILARGVYAALS